MGPCLIDTMTRTGTRRRRWRFEIVLPDFVCVCVFDNNGRNC